MYLGAHVSSSGGIENAIKEGDRYGINSIQMMPTAPMRWATKNIPDEDIKRFVETLKGSGIKKILLHGIYLTNLAREDKQLFHLGKMGLVVYLDFANRVGQLIKKNSLDVEILGVCFHPGSQKELNYEDSLERISYGIDWVLKEVGGTQWLLIESTAGTGTNMGRSFTELKAMRDGCKEKGRVGYVLDTQHTYVAGYDWIADMDSVVEEIGETLGYNRVKAIHLNDSMMSFASNKDRHANLGEGKLGDETVSNILHRKEFKDIPFILETPALKSSSTMEKEILHLKELAK
ncbi:MAG: apurinic endonuclease Apn1, deoxyribonuclease IV [candidate division WS6 bacterium GW2011_GWE2_33_157]|uniref:Putative endonuclease 4 n=1 Tax=candidate division WS6 bacterium GW2011_GWB1_33_6 TaxID=1619088 RepID=A0A0G0AVH0_9BACT|nr:MAG: apurinic endonuclease Apn1, deoxyribonuclease IV [candidate division WS6 bacterium GW2011_GWE2_33_157]KKP45891.1 MAG: apurinic endonuclease Apn1, deoxyribonuclease IV [candidate division WS6 bacterium GW2011_GWF1_33_233]KKP55113.1 MAG: apurinic endonuclease Apn1, deoxyribonuclease IV [candidate division WS6 bacterium GW2011_WS6_33_547]KKP55351.1 MAG: putative endonuclease 4 [candidate division WS6 bacterium GW2011_GWB1_33_6]KKP57178.1 MAG: putative endonuclease 4 [candidate division WS6